jgi:hypothetical protein
VGRWEAADVRWTQGNTALHLAITNRHHATLAELLNAGADVSVCNQETYPPLHVAALVGDVRVGANGSFPLSERDSARPACSGMEHVCVPVRWEHEGTVRCGTRLFRSAGVAKLRR